MRGRNDAVDETSVVQMYLILEWDELFRMLNAQYVAKQRQPVRLALPLLVTCMLQNTARPEQCAGNQSVKVHISPSDAKIVI